MLPRNSKSAPLANISCHFPAQSNVMNLWFIMNIGLCDKNNSLCWRPYRVECSGSLPTSEVKRRRARLVLGWGTAREDLRVLPAFSLASLVCFLVSFSLARTLCSVLLLVAGHRVRCVTPLHFGGCMWESLVKAGSGWLGGNGGAMAGQCSRQSGGYGCIWKGPANNNSAPGALSPIKVVIGERSPGTASPIRC